MPYYDDYHNELASILKHMVAFAPENRHSNYNGFIHFSFFDTMRNISTDDEPIGFCFSPDYYPKGGIAFVLCRKENGLEFWVHVTRRLYVGWLKELNVLDEVFPNGVKDFLEYPEA